MRPYYGKGRPPRILSLPGLVGLFPWLRELPGTLQLPVPVDIRRHEWGARLAPPAGTTGACMTSNTQESQEAFERGAHCAPLRVLYIHGCGTFGGASRSLITMIRAFPSGAVQPFIICPAGTAVDFFRETGAPVAVIRRFTQFDNSYEGYYRGRRWLVLLREMASVWDTIRALHQVRKWAPFDLVHVNEILLLLPTLLARRQFRAPVVMHVRLVQ